MPLRAGLLHLGDGVNHLARVVAAGAGQHERAAVGFLDDDLDDARSLGRRQRRRFAGRAAGHEEVDAGVDLAPGQPAHGRLRRARRLRERSDERGADAGEFGLMILPVASRAPASDSHQHYLPSCPRSRTAPSAQPFRGLERAAREHRAVADLVRERDGVGRTIEARPRACRGSRRRASTTRRWPRRSPRRSIADLSISAVPDGASFLAA